MGTGSGSGTGTGSGTGGGTGGTSGTGNSSNRGLSAAPYIPETVAIGIPPTGIAGVLPITQVNASTGLPFLV